MRSRASETFERRRTHSCTSERHEASSSRKGAVMSDAMNNPYANDPNTNNPNQNDSNGQQPQGQPEYGAYAPNQQSQSQQQGGNPNNSGNPYQSEPQIPRYFGDPNANQTRTRTASSTQATPPANRTDSRTANQEPAMTIGSRSARSNLRRNGCPRRRRTRSAAPMQYLASPPSSSA